MKKGQARLLQYKNQKKEESKRAVGELRAIEAFLQLEEDAEVQSRHSTGWGYGWYLVWGDGNYSRHLDIETDHEDLALMRFCFESGRHPSWDRDSIRHALRARGQHVCDQESTDEHLLSG